MRGAVRRRPRPGPGGWRRRERRGAAGATRLYWVGRGGRAGLSPGNSSDPFEQTGTAATEQIQRERGGRGVVKTEFPAWSKERPVTGQWRRAAAGRGLSPSRAAPSRIKKKKKAEITCL